MKVLLAAILALGVFGCDRPSAAAGAKAGAIHGLEAGKDSSAPPGGWLDGAVQGPYHPAPPAGKK